MGVDVARRIAVSLNSECVSEVLGPGVAALEGDLA